MSWLLIIKGKNKAARRKVEDYNKVQNLINNNDWEKTESIYIKKI